ncbi:MAG: DNA/RNA non-specific endonuclease [Bacteroidales bacterium]
MNRVSLIFLLAVLHFGLSAQAYLPTSTTNFLIAHSHYTLSYCTKNKQAEWVYYELNTEMLKGSQSRTNSFRPDPKVKEGSSSLKDYRYSGYDRGHLCPAADMKMSPVSMEETFYLSNISPQNPSFNRGIWSALESVVRNWTETKGRIYVVTGGVLSSAKSTIGENKVAVPSYFYKIVYAPDQDKMIAFILPNKKGKGHLTDYVVSVDYVESLTGIDFFADLDTDIQNRLEHESNHTLWSFGRNTNSNTAGFSEKVISIINFFD